MHIFLPLSTMAWHRKGLLDGSQWPFDLSRRRMTARWPGARRTHTHIHTDTRATDSKQMSGQRMWPSPTALFGAVPRGGGGADRLRCLRSPTVASARQCNVRNRHIITSARACRHDHRSSAQARRHAGPALKLACDRFLHERRIAPDARERQARREEKLQQQVRVSCVCVGHARDTQHTHAPGAAVGKGHK